ncbi:hypothetical protein YA0089_26570 [Pseudomonas viridiflava]|uniref:hypothetical protein n=1 Tax=Pseudomonas viridiflava TaxID=33069 RepID=UPI0018E5BEB9|nr:hypothetical protein [Pseudomonas viridiflava]MBI6727182.1 hypothetical protein [Pseudomonas viridiflava]
MKIFAGVVTAFLLAASLQGCVSRLNGEQEQMLSVYESKGFAVHEKNVGLSYGLGVLPIAGYAYNGHYVLMITTIPLYPFLGPLWMPFDAAASARSTNYYATQRHVELLKRQEKKVADQEMEDKKITYEQHVRKEREIEDKYSPY